MSLAPITLTTDKSTAVIDDAHRKLRQDESGLSITVTVLNEDNTAYDLTGKNLVFCENKKGNKVIVDDGKGDNSGKFNRNSDNDTKGIFNYVLQEDAYAASGMAWFEINDGTTVDSTKNFYLDVERDASVSLSNNDYIGSLKALETAMAGAQNKVTGDLANMEAQITQQIADTKTASESEITQAIKKLTDQTTAALSNVDEYTQKLNTLQNQWDSELQSIKTKASTDTDSAVKAINDRYTNDFAKLQSDFTSWQTSTTQNYQKQVDAILAQVQGDETTVANLQKQVDATAAKMQDLNKQFSSVDFTQFLKPSALDNYYTKSEVDGKLTTVGAVKKVADISPNDDGNVPVPSYAPNLLLGTQEKPKTVDMSAWSANADVYSIDPSIDLSGHTVTVSLKLAKSTNDAMVVLQYTDSTGKIQYPNGNVVPAGNTGYSTMTQVLPANVKNIDIRPSWTNGTVTGTCTYSEAKLAVWKSADLPPDMTWVPNEADKANSSDVTSLQNAVNNKVNVDGDLFLAPGSINSWADVQADGYKNVLRSVRTEGQATDFDTGNYDAGIVFGGNDTKALISVGYAGNQARVTGGSSSAVWHEDIAWKSDITNLQSMITGLSTKVDSLQQNSLKIVPITQADYDALSTKDPNTIYAIGG